MAKFAGIVPSIEILREMFEEINNEITPLVKKENLENSEVLNKMNLIKRKIDSIKIEVDKSYGLIRLVIDSIHSSRSELKKSVDGLLKKTGAQLQKVTSTTEEATNKIMDVAEHLDDEQMTILDLLEKLKENDDAKNSLIDEITEKIHQNQDAAFTIIDFLQFQDITAQQIAGAYSLLSDTEKTLLYVAGLLNEFDEVDDSSKGSTEHYIDKNAFNSDAKFVDKKDIQNAIDNLFETKNTDIEIPKDKEDELKPIAATSKSSVEQSEEIDIDALFATGNDNKKNEEEIDIDALFK
jgi:hypothetical protein